VLAAVHLGIRIIHGEAIARKYVLMRSALQERRVFVGFVVQVAGGDASMPNPRQEVLGDERGKTLVCNRPRLARLCSSSVAEPFNNLSQSSTHILLSNTRAHQSACDALNYL
jgi:hypothetical protein